MTLSSSCITHDNSNLISPDTTFLIAGLRVTVTSTFPGRCNCWCQYSQWPEAGDNHLGTPNDFKEARIRWTAFRLLQTIWSECNIKGKEELLACVKLKREKLTLQMKIFHCFSWYSVISSSGFYKLQLNTILK